MHGIPSTPELFSRIVATALSTQKLCERWQHSNEHRTIAPASCPDIYTPELNFEISPSPNFYQELTTLGFPPLMAKTLAPRCSQIFEPLRSLVQQQMQSAIARTLAAAPSRNNDQRDKLVAKMHSTFDGFYRRRVADLSQEVIQKIATRFPRQSTPSLLTKTQFNHAFTPFLETYFEKNAYPSQADRALFARKSMMTPRQIEVWFQNHRRRARKEGRPILRRRPDDRSLIDLEALAKYMPDQFVSESQRSSIVESDWDDDNNNDYHSNDLSDEEDTPDWTGRHVLLPGALDILDIKAPPHAFPVIFSECSKYHPFPTTDEGFTFPPPLWTRKPATQRVNRPSPDFEDLTARFERLSLLTPLMTGSRKTGSGKHSRPTSIEPSSAKRQYPLPTTFTPITPPIGRHPAFVPTPLESYASPATSKPTIPIVRAPDSRLHAFQTPAPESLPVSLMPSSAPSSSVPVYKNIPPRRQVARLPRRTPQSQSVAHRSSSIHPVTTPSSPSSPSSVSSGSRTSSFDSLFSSHTRTSSSGSDTSLPNMPITPTFSPTPLQPPAPVTATDFSFTDDLFGDSLFDLSFPPNAFQLNGFGNASKPIQTPSYNDFNFNFTPSQFLQA